MKVNLANAASRRTREAIRQAFAELLSEKGSLARITVTELVARAGVTRGTFYTHYDNIYQVAVEFEQEILEVAHVGREDLRSIEDIEKYFDTVFDYLEEHEQIYRVLLTSDAPMTFLNRVNAQLREKLTEVLPKREELELDVSFFADGTMYLLLRYFRGELKPEAGLEGIKKYTLVKFRELIA